MSIAAPSRGHDALAGVEHDPIEALIEEAREHARRRRRRWGVAASVAAIAVVAAIVGFNGAGSSPAQRAALDPAAESPVGDLGVFEPIRGWIVFADGAGIYAVDPNNPLSRHTVLENPDGISSHLSPAGWSTDGTELALDDEGESGSWIMDSTGALTNVAQASGCCTFVSRQPTSPDVLIANVGGVQLAVWRLADGTASAIAFPVPDRITDLENDTTRQSETPLIQLGHAALSNDGEQLLLTAPGEREHEWLPNNPTTTRGLYIAAVDGSTMRRIDAGSYVAAVWSPDGTEIAAISAPPPWRGRVYRPAEDRELVVMNADGTDKQTLTELDSQLFTGIAWHPLTP